MIKEPFIPKTDYIYPNDVHSHMITVKHKHDVTLDENYVYRDKSAAFRFKRFWFRVFEISFIMPVTAIRYGLKVKGKKELKKYAKELDDGFISVGNHVFYWDYLCYRAAMFPRTCEVPIWETNMTAGLAGAYKLAGAIPVPTKSHKGTKLFSSAMNEVLDDGKWLHIYAEASMWFYYVPIRTFKDGAFMLARDKKKPVLPLVITYRPAGKLRRLLGQKEPLATVHIGTPQFANTELPRREAIEELNSRVRSIMIKMAGINDEQTNEQIAKDCYSYGDGHLYV